jgi:lysophospholipid acyltransferase (LPLAT)-like uncharacterized protein
MDSSKPNGVEQEPPDRPSGLAHRLAVWFISTASYCLIQAICATLRWEIEGMEHHRSILAGGRRVIFAFWHGRILMATYFWRRRGIVVMTSRSREGDYIARLISLFGYGSARGSSSRGSRRALVEMIRELRRKLDVAFTIDGPRGPRYVAKPGAAWLAAKTGDAILPFHISCRNRWVVASWDRFQIPKPFSRVLVLIGAPIYVRTDATAGELEASQQSIQRSLDELRMRGDSRWGGKPGQ